MPRWLAVIAAGAVLGAMVIGPASAQEAGDASTAFDVTVTAEVVEAGAPVEVEATAVQAEDNRLAHGVQVTWTDAGAAVLGDERFTHHVSAEQGEGDLVIAGRGCGASWSEAEQEVIHPCTLDLRVIPVEQGETHEYPVWIYPEVGPLHLAAGTYVVEQPVHWWRPNAEDAQQQFTLRLTYEVQERQVPLDIDVQAQVVEAGAPASVKATEVTDASGQPSHEVVVTWNGNATARLDDARFTHHVEAAEGEGHLVIAGRGCGAHWNEETQDVEQVCTDDLRLIDLDEGEAHEYPVRVYPSVGSVALAPGTYTVDEVIGWESGSSSGEFTVRLTYTVTEGTSDPGDGTLTPEPADSGLSLATWGGGGVDQLPEAVSYWAASEGEWIGYLPDAPTFVNEAFLALFPDGSIPAGTTLLVVR